MGLGTHGLTHGLAVSSLGLRVRVRTGTVVLCVYLVRTHETRRFALQMSPECLGWLIIRKYEEADFP